MHVPQKGLIKAMFPACFISVCARQISFALKRERAHEQGFLEQSACVYQMHGCPFVSYVEKT